MNGQPAPELVVDRRDGILRLTINRPDKANALNLSIQAAIEAELAAAAADQQVRAVVLTGAGERVFCAGADFSEPIAGAAIDQARARAGQLLRLSLALTAFPKPLVAAVNGHAVGSGFMLALLADARVAAEAATFSLPEILRGQPTYAGAVLLARLLGDAAAADLVLSGRRMDSGEALARGLLSEVCAPAELADRAHQAAVRLGGHAPDAFRLNKAWIRRDYRALLEQAATESDALRRAALRQPNEMDQDA